MPSKGPELALNLPQPNKYFVSAWESECRMGSTAQKEEIFTTFFIEIQRGHLLALKWYLVHEYALFDYRKFQNLYYSIFFRVEGQGRFPSLRGQWMEWAVALVCVGTGGWSTTRAPLDCSRGSRCLNVTREVNLSCNIFWGISSLQIVTVNIVL